MPLTPGAHLGPYEILAPLGAGGMGEVYRARDSSLGRDVALKVLPETFASDPERVARFRREAQMLATLNHPHIGAIYGLEESDANAFLVLELVDGGTLAQRIAGRPLPIDEAIDLARQIAEALEAAHEKGVVHRDLKPANVALTADGRVKILDFGLAKAIDPIAAPDLSHSPTLTFAATQAGVILGTAAYMSPEQAKGRAADKRSDVWAFGCVLYEMLTGTRAFEAEDVSDTLAAVLRGEPDWSALPADLPPSLRALIEGCLKKDRAQRIGDLSTARFLLSDPRALTAPPAASPAAVSAARRRGAGWFIWAGVTLFLLMLVGALIIALVSRRPPAPHVMRFTVPLPSGQQFTNVGRRSVAVSPDGSMLAYVADQKLFLRALSELDARALVASDGGRHGLMLPTFSPDSKSIAYYSADQQAIKRIAVSGGAPLTVCAASMPFDLTWSRDGLVFDQTGKGLVRVPSAGGTPTVIVPVTGRGDVPYGPQLLPGGEWLLFSFSTAAQTGADRSDSARVVVRSLKSGEQKTVVDGGSDARYLSSGHLVYAIGGVLFAVPFDLATRTTTGGPVPVVEGIARGVSTGTVHFSVSDTGTLAYIPGPISPDGTRFLGTVAAEQSASGTNYAPQINLVLNWFEEVRQRVPVK